MELQKDLPIFDYISKYTQEINENEELEIIIYPLKGKYTETEFNNFTNVFRSLNYTENIEKECLSVYAQNVELNIHGISSIIKYCNTASYNTDTVEWVRHNTIMEDEVKDLFDDAIKFTKISKTKTQEPEFWDDNLKNFKMNKKISYTLDGVKYISNIFKTNDEDFHSMKQSNVLKQEQMYDFRVVITKKDINIIQCIVTLLRAIHMSNMILTKQQQNDIINEYHMLVKDDIKISGYNKKSSIPLLAPKPVTLELSNMVDPKNYGAISILSGYTVTEKADGERILMYINGNGKVYLINNSLQVEYTGQSVPKAYYNSLIDGEYIPCDKRKDDSSKNLYACFDMYYSGGKLITSLPLIDTNASRYSKLQEIVKHISKGEVDVIVKEHRYSENILSDAKDILTNTKTFPYEVDGLVFTPSKLAVYSYYTNRNVQLTDNVKWDRVFKWKPEDQNTIDFLISFGKTITKQGIKYKEIKLYVGYNTSQWENLTIEKALKLRYDKAYAKMNDFNSSAYIPILFKPKTFYTAGVESAYVKINSSGDIRAINGDKIENNSIVEFQYNNDNDLYVSERWKPLRVRDDKTRIYRNEKTLSKTANDYGVALNIWRSIHNPVTIAMIMGNENISSKHAIENLDTEDIYYTRNISRDNLLSVHMLNFHNQGIKKYLYKDIPKKKGSLLELCCGDGGDMNRWIDSGYNFILGIDFVKHNIYNPVSGGYSRMMKRRKQFIRKGDNTAYFPNIVFAAGDCAAYIKNGETARAIKDNESEKILKIVMNKQNSYEPHLKYVTGKGADGFDVVSCMFAVHYFFENEGKLDGFLRNVADNLKQNGVFFCTFMNGDRVHNEIMKNDGDKIEGIKLKTENYEGMPVWAIIRRYSKENTNIYGKKIDVYIENTKKLIPEYLISFQTLVQKAKDFGLEIEKTEMFEETFDKIKKNINKEDLLYKDIMELDKDEIQKKFSFLNQWAVFKKI
jgi:SAM-dependent methyltransferase